MKLHNSVVLSLPFPPTANTHWRHVELHGRVCVLLSRKGRAYRSQVVRAARGHGDPLNGPLRVTVWVWMPDRRARDLDNLLKPLLDALTHAGVWGDDSQIVDLRITRRGVRPGGGVVVRAMPISRQGDLFATLGPPVTGPVRGPGGARGA